MKKPIWYTRQSLKLHNKDLVIYQSIPGVHFFIKSLKYTYLLESIINTLDKYLICLVEIEVIYLIATYMDQTYTLAMKEFC